MRANHEDGKPPIGPELERVIATIAKLEDGVFMPLAQLLRQSDHYFHCADFQSYAKTQRLAAQTWLRPDDWTAISIRNTARSGPFSGDRTVAEYARDIWRVDPVAISSD